MALLKKIGSIFKKTVCKLKRIPVESKAGEDRLESPEKDPARGLYLRGRFSRRYIILAGSYLVVVAVLLSFIVIKWVKIPPWEIPGLPGLEEEAEYRLQEGKIPQEVSPVIPENAATTEAGEASVGDPISGGEEMGKIDLVPVLEEDEQAPLASEGETVFSSGAAKVVLPEAAVPLPQWFLQSPFGSYSVEKLPSGNLHRLSQGVLLRTALAAPVSVLWAGKVIATGDADSSWGLSVLVEHEGGYLTFYGNLGEVWVEEGTNLRKGEDIGLLPQNPSLKGAITASGQSQGEVQKLPIRNVWGGYYDEETGTILPELQPDHYCVESGTGFYEEGPLLYLEVRQDHKYLDPLEFIPDRN